MSTPKTDWKPGDIATVTTIYIPKGMKATCYETCTKAAPFGCWELENGDLVWSSIKSVKPLQVVVIDPEDRAQVERLSNAILWAGTIRTDSLQAALRSFLVPPKPAEPTGLGAVVTSEARGTYVRISVEETHPWRNVQDWACYKWADVPATRVLSEGVVTTTTATEGATP